MREPVRINHKIPHEPPIPPHETDLTSADEDNTILQINPETLTRISVELTNLNSILEIRLDTHNQ